MGSGSLIATALFALVTVIAPSSLRAGPPQEPDNYAAHFNHGGELIQQMKFHEAVSEFREAIRLNANYLPAHQALVVAYAFAHCFDLSWMEVAYVRDAAAPVDEKFIRTLNEEMSETDASSKRAANARELANAKEAVNGESNNAAAHARLSHALANAGDFPAAQYEAYTALQINPTEPEAHLVLAMLLIPDPSTDQQALPHLKLYLRNVTRTTSTSPDIELAYELLSDYYSQRSMESEALQVLREGLRSYPNDAHLLNKAAWIYSTATDKTLRDPKQALALAQEAVDMTRAKRSAYLDTLAESLYANGAIENAIIAEQKAIALSPDNNFYQDQLKKFQNAKGNVESRKP